MKKLITSIVLALVSIQCIAQKDTISIYKAWDDLLAKVKKEKNPTAKGILKFTESDPTLAFLREQFLSTINQSLSVQQASEPWKEYTASYQHKPGDLNLFPMMEEAPSPIATLPLAAQPNADATFNLYIEKIKSQDKQLGEQIAKNSKLQEVYHKEGEEGVQKRAMAESDKSAIIQQMGGMDKLMKMSDAERKAAAMKMASELKANPGLILANQPVQPGHAPTAEEHEKLTAERNESKYAQDIILMNTRVQNRVGAATSVYNKQLESIDNWQVDINREIDAWYKSRFSAIPIVELGEYGHDKDPQQVIALSAAVECIRYFTLEIPEMQLRADSWKRYKSRCKEAIAELNDFVGDYKWGKHPSSDIFAPGADEQVASGIRSAYGLMVQLAEEAKNLTAMARGYQKRFEAQGK